MLQPYLDQLTPIVLHTVVIYLFLILMLRCAARRQMGQLTVVDLVIIILLGSAVETAMVHGDTTLQTGIVCAATLLLLNRTFCWLLGFSRRARHLVQGGPMVLIHDGQFVEEHLRRAGLTNADVMEALREREQGDVAGIRFAVLDVDGSINVIPMEAATLHIPAAWPSQRGSDPPR